MQDKTREDKLIRQMNQIGLEMMTQWNKNEREVSILYQSQCIAQLITKFWVALEKVDNITRMQGVESITILDQFSKLFRMLGYLREAHKTFEYRLFRTIVGESMNSKDILLHDLFKHVNVSIELQDRKDQNHNIKLALALTDSVETIPASLSIEGQLSDKCDDTVKPSPLKLSKESKKIKQKVH